MRKFLFLLFAASVLVSCSKYEEPPAGLMDKYYFVKTDGIALAVRVAGKIDSDVAIIATHGGPGGSSQTFRFTNGFRTLENNYKIVYWDQRASGITQGNPSTSQINIEQYSKDVDAIVEFTRQIVGAKSVFLLGHSWGGGLTAYYLQDQQSHQDKLKGYISVCPAYNVVGGLGASRQWVINAALVRITLNKDVDYWRKALQFYERTPIILAGSFLDHATYLGKADGALFNKKAPVLKSYLPAFESQPIGQNPFFVGENMTIGGKEIYGNMDLTPLLGRINLPTLLMWGDKDGLLPPDKVPNHPAQVELVNAFMNGISTPDSDKQFVRYMQSAHQPMQEEGLKFAVDVALFIEKYK
jgi:pimeloyl-ACP methyl ester carboxylesterase